MAETMTYDSGTDTVTTESNLTEAEKESLVVGEEMQNQQEQLLAGKYKNAQELEKAYGELQKKLGEQTEDSKEEEAGEPEAEADKEDATDDEPSAAVSLINEASTEYYANDGKLKAETIEKFSSMSSQELVNAYLEVTKNNPQPKAEEVADVSQREINSIQNSVGGEKEYGKLIEWAGSNLDTASVEAFDDVVATGNAQMIKLAISGIKAQYDNANGYEGRMLSGKSPKVSGDVFRSQPELVAAMTDPRYDDDPAYRQDVIEKLDRSDLNF